MVILEMTTLTTAKPAVGNTQKETVARYGQPIYQKEKDGKTLIKFIREHTSIITEMQNRIPSPVGKKRFSLKKDSFLWGNQKKAAC